MIREFRFKDVEKYLKKSSDTGKEIMDMFSDLTNAAVIFGTAALGPEFLPLLEILDVTDRLHKIGHRLVDYISRKTEPSYLERLEQIKMAYGLICYTAYFDLLEDSLPKKLRKRIRNTFKDAAVYDEIVKKKVDNAEQLSKVYYVDHSLSMSEAKKLLFAEYTRVTQNILRLIDDAKAYNVNNAQERAEREVLFEDLSTLPEKAVEQYEAQYLALAVQFDDFALFAQLKSCEQLGNAVAKNREALNALLTTSTQIDVGLKNLNVVVNSIATNYREIQVQDIVDDLKMTYLNAINGPIIEEREVRGRPTDGQLQFPRIVDAFIPQSYKVLQYMHRATKLEDEAAWKNSPVCQDLDKFFIQYLYSPDSVDCPLIILGQPGSGKSLLTKVLSAQLMCNSYTVIRVPLREVSADADIDVLVEDQIKKVTNRRLGESGYGGFAKQFSEKPLIIILDGYDELLQAKGMVYAGYLQKIVKFQQEQKGLQRPVRVIVTSRITLIDKARIPINSTVLRLMEFDAHQRAAWIEIWNATNAGYFAANHVKPFELPVEKGRKKNILELAEQPLLLMMLALYDSEANDLSSASNMRRTELYDNLSRRFIRRERSRYVPGFNDKSENEQECIIDQEMVRYGIIAIGMYNREDVVIRTKELEHDIELFHAHREDGSPSKNAQAEAESVVGSFFFIHQSTALDNDPHNTRAENAYEFLHNTFGEFFAADFILRSMIAEVRKAYINKHYLMANWHSKSNDPDFLDTNWFYCLMFVPLFSRPVVVEMLREHAERVFERTDALDQSQTRVDIKEFLPMLEELTKIQLKMVLRARQMPKVMCEQTLIEKNVSLLGLLATYSVNLIIVSSTLNAKGFSFNQSEFCSEDENKEDAGPWHSLTALWKTWFSTVELVGLSAIITAKKSKDKPVVTIKRTDKGDATHYVQPIDTLLCVSHTLADPLLTGLAGLQSAQFSEITSLNYREIGDMLKDESIEMYMMYLVNTLKEELMRISVENEGSCENVRILQTINKIVQTIIHEEHFGYIRANALIAVLEIIEHCLLKNTLFLATRKELLGKLSEILKRMRFPYSNLSNNPIFAGIIRIMRLIVKDKVYWIQDHHWDGLEFQTQLMHENKEKVFSAEAELLPCYTFDPMTEPQALMSISDNNFNIGFLKHKPFSAFSRSKRINVLHEEYMFSHNGIRIMLELCPEWYSSFLLAVCKSKEIGHTQLSEIVEVFLKEMGYMIETIGFPYIAFGAILNAIKIANIMGCTWFRSDIEEILSLYTIGSPVKHWSAFVQFCPSQFADLMEEIPDIMSRVCFDMYRIFSPEYFRNCKLNEQFIEYIRVLRLLHNYFQEHERKNKRYHKLLRMFPMNISERWDIDFNKLTNKQISDLIWYADEVNDAELGRRIKMQLRESFGALCD